MLNQQQIFERLGAMSLSSYRPESAQLLDPPVVLSQPENVQAKGQWPDNELEECLAQGSFPWEASEQHNQADNERPLVHDSQRFAQVEAQEHAPANTTERENNVWESAQQFADGATNLDQNREQRSDSQSYHERSSRPDRTSQELQNIAQAYITAGNHKNLPDSVRMDINDRPFTKTELQQLKLYLKTAQEGNQIDKEARQRLSKIIQWQNEQKKQKSRKYNQSEKTKRQKEEYEKSDKGKLKRKEYKRNDAGMAKTMAKQTDAQILKIPGVEVFEVQDFGSSSQNFTPSGTGSFSTFELSKNDQEEE